MEIVRSRAFAARSDAGHEVRYQGVVVLVLQSAPGKEWTETFRCADLKDNLDAAEADARALLERKLHAVVAA